MDYPTLSQMRSCVLLTNVCRFVRLPSLRRSLERYGEVADIQLMHRRSDHVYTNCCLVRMGTVAEADLVIRGDPPMAFNGLKVTAKRYSHSLCSVLLDMGIYEVGLMVPPPVGQQIDANTYYEDLQLGFQGCNVTDIRLRKKDGLYTGGAYIYVRTLADCVKAERFAQKFEDRQYVREWDIRDVRRLR